MTETLRWVEQHTKPVSCLSEPSVLREVFSTIGTRTDGRPAAASVVSKRRRVLFNALEYAVERQLLAVNPLPTFKWRPPKVSSAVARRSVVNPVQARSLHRAVAEGRQARLAAFFGLMYSAALRPEEAANVHKRNLILPEEGWGELHIDEATPYAGSAWTDSGKHRDRRQLKNRGQGESRAVPCPPELTRMLHDHLAKFGTASEGRLFPVSAWRSCHTWPTCVFGGPLARRPSPTR